MSHQTGSMDTLETILGIAPDLLPCQLAIICLKPCKQVSYDHVFFYAWELIYYWNL